MSESAGISEQTFIENEFGTVTSKRVIYFRSKGWFNGGSREDIPLQHVTSVRMDISRSILGGILLLLLGLTMLAAEGPMKLVAVVLLALAALLFWGSPAVVVNTSGRDMNAAKGLPWKRSQADAFVEALRHQLFNK